MNKIPMLCTNSASDRVCQSLTDIGFLRQIPLFRDLKIEYSFRHMTHKHISLIFTMFSYLFVHLRSARLPAGFRVSGVPNMSVVNRDM